MNVRIPLIALTLCGLGFSATAAADETRHWQTLIDSASATGGGRVVVGAGRHLVGQLNLKSNVELHIEKGAVLEGLVGLEHYTVTELPYSEGTWSAIVSAIGVTNVAITGEGEIFGNGTAWEVPENFGGNQEGLRARGVFFADSQDIRLSGFTLRDTACWGVVFKCCRCVRARNVTVDNHANVNNDGFDVEASDVIIEDCDVDSGDDAYCLKSNNPDFIVENVVVRNCRARSHSNGCKIGTATHGTIRNVLFENIRCEAPRRDFVENRRSSPLFGKLHFCRPELAHLQAGGGLGAIALECVDGGCVEDVTVRNVEVSGFVAPIFVRAGTRNGRACGTPPGNQYLFRRLVIQGVRGRSETAIASSITGVDGCRVSDVSLKDIDIACAGASEEASHKAMVDPVPNVAKRYPECTMFRPSILPAFGLYVDRVDGLTMENVRFSLWRESGDVRPPVYLTSNVTNVRRQGGEDLCRFVNPFVGTDGPGHTFPAAARPFGMVQAGPDTGTGAWDYCSGYQYRDQSVLGYSQTHLNGTGCPDLGDIQVLPFSGEVGKLPMKRTIDKKSEKASPGWYEVRQPDDGVKVEIAAAKRAAIYRFTWEKGRDAKVLVNIPFGIEQPWTNYHIKESDVTICGLAGFQGILHKTGWIKDRKVAFRIEFDRPWTSAEELPRDCAAPRYVVAFDTGEKNVVLMKVALSMSDADAAERNLEDEIPDWDVERVRDEARDQWNDLLSRSTCEGSDDQKRNWYTALYHLYLQPNDYSDMGKKPYYTTLSLWDTFRASHPWYSIVTPEIVMPVIDSTMELWRQNGRLPVMSYGGKNIDCMIGNHSIPVIVDAFFKEVQVGSRSRTKDVKNSTVGLPPTTTTKYWESIYAAIKNTLTQAHAGKPKEDWWLYDNYGYFPCDLIRGESVSRTFECCYDDWCAAQMAKRLGKMGDYEFFMKRAQNWKNVFDSSIGFGRGKTTAGKWRELFDPYAVGHGADTDNDFTEGNAFQYSWHVMQDVPGLVAAMGGRERFVARLDSLFAAPDKVQGVGMVVDVTGLIGQYVHGNEPSHHVIYFYPQVGQPEKAAERIREVFDKFYLPKIDGLCGNDDCGQMSAWYLFSAMGFYPFNPCGGEYIIGAPQVPRARVKVKGEGEQWKLFTMTAKNLSEENKYVKSVMLNGKTITDWKIRHEDIVKGGELVFEMEERQ